MNFTRKVTTLTRSHLETDSSWEDQEQVHTSASPFQVHRNDHLKSIEDGKIGRVPLADYKCWEIPEKWMQTEMEEWKETGHVQKSGRSAVKRELVLGCSKPAVDTFSRGRRAPEVRSWMRTSTGAPGGGPLIHTASRRCDWESEKQNLSRSQREIPCSEDKLRAPPFLQQVPSLCPQSPAEN